jgi:hypothetical protein
MKTISISGALWTMLFVATATHAQTTIDFEEFPIPRPVYRGTELPSQEFIIRNFSDSVMDMLSAVIPSCSPPCANNGTQNLLAYNGHF